MTRKESVLRFFDQEDAYIQTRIESGIELNRKGDATIVLKSQNGEPLPADITVEAKQRSHEFKFGANLFMLDEFPTEEKNAIYREKFPEIFNLATLPFYWSTLEPEMGKPRYAKDSPRIYRRPPIDLCIDYCKEKGIEPKCHCLNYDTESPKWYIGQSVSFCKKKLLERFQQIADRYSKDIPTFEVTNETLKEGFSKFFYEDDFVEWSFKMADRIFPNNKLIINDFKYWLPNVSSNRNLYYMQIERLLRTGHRVDSIGLQFHCMFGFRQLDMAKSREAEAEQAEIRYNPRVLFQLMDNFGKLGIPQQITEMTVSALSEDPEDEEVQAELTNRLYRCFFSHPAMEAIIYWNLVDGYAASAKPGDMTRGENRFYGGFLRHDLSEKPVYKMLKKLVNEQWHTETAVKAVDGTAKFRGFYGDYDLTVFAGGKQIPAKITLSKEKKNTFTLLI